MQVNASMKNLLKRFELEFVCNIPLNNALPIWEKTDCAGRSYWGVSSFWGMDAQPISADRDLSQLEWGGNEVWLGAQSDEETKSILRQAIGIMAFWKEELEARYPEMPFYILASYDNGDMQIVEEGELPTRNVTMRFWADRGNNTVINLEEFENWKQPAMIEYCNFAHQNR